MKPSQVDVDAIMDSLGVSRCFHITQYILLSSSLLISAFNSYLFIFTALAPEYQCKNLTEFQLFQYNISIDEVNLSYGKCSIEIIRTDERITVENQSLSCLNGYYYTFPVDMSISSQWNLVCSRGSLAEASQTIYIFGQLFGALISPYFFDRFGRKPLRVLCNFLLVVINLICAFSTSYAMFASMRFFAGFSREAYTISTFAAIPELCSKSNRVLMGSISIVLWSLWSSFIGCVAYFMKDCSWNYFYLLNAALSGFFLIEILFGHKISLTFSKLFVTLLTFLASFLKLFAEDNKTNEHIYVALFLISMLGLSATFCGNYIYTPELYPTQIRSIAFGVPVTLSRIACSVAPFFKLLTLYAPWASGFTMGSACLISAILVWVFLPETKNRVLSQTIEDLNKIRREEKMNKINM